MKAKIQQLVESYPTTWEFLSDLHEVLIELHEDEPELAEALRALDRAAIEFEEQEDG